MINRPILQSLFFIYFFIFFTQIQTVNKFKSPRLNFFLRNQKICFLVTMTTTSGGLLVLKVYLYKIFIHPVMHPNPAFKMLYWLCLGHHKNLLVIYDFSSGVSRLKRSSSVCIFVGLNLFPSGRQEILRIPMFRNPHIYAFQQ